MRGKSSSATTASMTSTLIATVSEQAAGLAEPHRLALGDRPLAHAQRVGVARGEQLLPQAEPAADDEAEDRGERQHADAADLDADEDEHVAERRPVGRHVDGREAGDADHRDRGEERVDERRALAGASSRSAARTAA